MMVMAFDVCPVLWAGLECRGLLRFWKHLLCVVGMLAEIITSLCGNMPLEHRCSCVHDSMHLDTHGKQLMQQHSKFEGADVQGFISPPISADFAFK